MFLEVGHAREVEKKVNKNNIYIYTFIFIYTHIYKYIVYVCICINAMMKPIISPNLQIKIGYNDFTLKGVVSW